MLVGVRAGWGDVSSRGGVAVEVGVAVIKKAGVGVNAKRVGVGNWLLGAEASAAIPAQ